MQTNKIRGQAILISGKLAFKVYSIKWNKNTYVKMVKIYQKYKWAFSFWTAHHQNTLEQSKPCISWAPRIFNSWRDIEKKLDVACYTTQFQFSLMFQTTLTLERLAQNLRLCMHIIGWLSIWVYEASVRRIGFPVKEWLFPLSVILGTAPLAETRLEGEVFQQMGGWCSGHGAACLGWATLGWGVLRVREGPQVRVRLMVPLCAFLCVCPVWYFFSGPSERSVFSNVPTWSQLALQVTGQSWCRERAQP